MARGSVSSKKGRGAGTDGSSPLLALLLNTETKDEGEEFLDYAYPADDPALKVVAPMKGVLLASCGVMKAATGQEVSFFAFRSIDGKVAYKASIVKIERWFLCLIVLGSVSDRVARFLAEEAVGLATLRHGRLTSLQGHFGQLDPIFRALEGIWRSMELRIQAEPGRAPGASAALTYVSLGLVLWNPLADDLQAEVGGLVAELEQKWRASAQDPPLATPEGCAIFLDQELVSTSLSGSAFAACLRLCLLEGVLSAGAIAAEQRDGAVAPAKCHSLFLQQRYGRDAEMPSHQYGVLRAGPWVLFMLWRMASLEDAAPKGSPRQASAADPFGVDLCIELLGQLPMRLGYGSRSRDARALRGARAGSGHKEKKTFSLPCGALNPSKWSKSKKQGSLAVQEEDRPSPFLYALEMGSHHTHGPACACGADHSAAGFAIRQEPPQTAHDRLRPGTRLQCPEMVGRAASRTCGDWAPAAGAPEALREWADLEWLMREHEARRASWSLSPGLHATRHALQGALKGRTSLGQLWEECEERCEDGATGSSEGRRKPNVTKLGSGEPWRFQEGAPTLLSDLTPLVSVGSLVRPRPQAGEREPCSRRWVAVAARQLPGPSAGAKEAGAQAARGPVVLLHTDVVDLPPEAHPPSAAKTSESEEPRRV